MSRPHPPSGVVLGTFAIDSKGNLRPGVAPSEHMSYGIVVQKHGILYGIVADGSSSPDPAVRLAMEQGFFNPVSEGDYAPIPDFRKACGPLEVDGIQIDVDAWYEARHE